MSITAKDRRHIFALVRELNLDDDVRKDIQKRITGKESTTDMTPLDAGKLIAHLKMLRGPGRRVPKRAGRVPGNLNREPFLQKIEALLSELEAPWEYAEGIAWRVTGGRGTKPYSQPGVRRMEWVKKPDHFKAIIAALYNELKKRAAYARVHSLLAELGETEAWVDTWLNSNWRHKWKNKPGRCDAIAEILQQKLDREKASND